MATPAKLAKIALSLPGVSGQGVNFSVGKKGLCWAYLARSKPRAKREVVPGVVAFRCDLAVKDMLILTGPDRFFDDDHYRGYPAILGRLKLLEANEVEYLMWWAWRAQAPKSLQKSLHKGVA